MNNEQAVDRIVTLFEGLRREDVGQLDAHYTLDAWFKDPFNEVRGLEQVQRIYRHMFDALEAPHFRVTSRIVQEEQCFLAWEFHFGYRSWRKDQPQQVRGSSHLKLAPDGRIAWHRDYWDPAEEVYEKLPLLGALMRWLKRRGSS